ncbi:MAG: hypothetical protein ABGZ17_14450, partial [Planctomycetaceae bacterium]
RSGMHGRGSQRTLLDGSDRATRNGQHEWMGGCFLFRPFHSQNTEYVFKSHRAMPRGSHGGNSRGTAAYERLGVVWAHVVLEVRLMQALAGLRIGGPTGVVIS